MPIDPSNGGAGRLHAAADPSAEPSADTGPGRAGQACHAEGGPGFQLNEQRHPWQPGLTVQDALQVAGLSGDEVATALDGAFVPRSRRARTPVPRDAIVTVFRAIVGG